MNTGGKKIDAGAVAKGFISDKLLAFFKENGVKSGIINLGGNVCVFGEGEYTVAIQKPFSENENAAVMKLKNTTASTSGVYQRYFEADGVLYHHIIAPATGCPAKSDLLSVTVICESSAKADAFSTACIVMGKEGAAAFIEAQPGVEAVFIDGDQRVSYTSGVKKSGDFLILEK